MSHPILKRYLPEKAVSPCFELIKKHGVNLKIVNMRSGVHGDFRKLNDGSTLITVNATNNAYQFLITLIHEIAHLMVFKIYNRNVKPHGQEWKGLFRQLMSPFISTDIFPEEMLPVLFKHFENPRASSCADLELALAIRKFGDTDPDGKVLLMTLPENSTFRTKNGRIFKKRKQRVKRFECLEITSKKVFLFQPHAEVELMES